jgi:RNA polymerase sigma factor (sigma-70 family)
MDAAEVEMIRRAQTGEPAACADLWRRYRTAVAAVLAAYRSRTELEDLMQDVALAMVRMLPSLREVARFEPWLMQVTRNVARTSERRARVRSISRTESTRDLDSRAGADAPEREDGLWLALAALPPELREPLILKCVEGLPQRRVAELLGVPETTIETRLVRARRFLRDRIAKRDDERVVAPKIQRSVHP